MISKKMLQITQQCVPSGEHGTWEDLFAQISAGTYATTYEIGEILPLDLGGIIGAINAVIVGFDAVPLASGLGTAPVTLISEHLCPVRAWGTTLSGTTEGTGTIGGWEKCSLRAYIRDTVYAAIPAQIRARIAEVTAYSVGFDTSGTKITDMSSVEHVYIPAMGELGYTAGETLAPNFTYAKKRTLPDGTAKPWWTRSASSVSNVWRYGSTGSSSNSTVQTTTNGYPIMFNLI